MYVYVTCETADSFILKKGGILCADLYAYDDSRAKSIFPSREGFDSRLTKLENLFDSILYQMLICPVKPETDPDQT
jgi:hypothetical protein